jgi:protein-disulfide isomerase
VWKNLPLDMHRNAMGAHLAAVAASNQGKFWEFHDRLFANQAHLDLDSYEGYARELGLDMERFEQDRTSPETSQRIEADRTEARGLGLTGTPTFFVNGRILSGSQPFRGFAAAIDAELARLGLPVPSGAASG